MAVISMKALLESGVHFGHRTNKWHPKMRPYIFTERNGIHIIDLSQTAQTLESVYNMVRDEVMKGGSIMFVGTKRQAQETIQEEAERCGMPYVTERWLGGMLTNWSTIKKRISELERLEKMVETGDILRLTKKEGLLISRDIDRLQSRLGGVRDMKALPDLIFIVDITRESTAVHEANVKGIPVLAMVDTNCDPTNIDYVIPSNDDAIRAIKLIVGKIADAVLEGKSMLEKDGELAADAMEAASVLKPRRPARTAHVEEEMSDDDLLGASTLAKMTRDAETGEADSDESAE